MFSMRDLFTPVFRINRVCALSLFSFLFTFLQKLKSHSYFSFLFAEFQCLRPRSVLHYQLERL